MSFFKKLFGQKEKTESPPAVKKTTKAPSKTPAKKPAPKTSSSSPKLEKPTFVNKERTPGGTYEVYKGKDAESAKAFLMKKRVDEKLYYIVVETPEGNWGMDIKGLYLERLLPFQTNINSAKCTGMTCGMPDMFGLEAAARGMNDNFISQVECGKCNHQWQDALRYQNLTVVKCPKCKTLNKIDSSNFNVYFS